MGCCYCCWPADTAACVRPILSSGHGRPGCLGWTGRGDIRFQSAEHIKYWRGIAKHSRQGPYAIIPALFLQTTRTPVFGTATTTEQDMGDTRWMDTRPRGPAAQQKCDAPRRLVWQRDAVPAPVDSHVARLRTPCPFCKTASQGNLR